MKTWVYYVICFMFIIITSDLVGKYDASLFGRYWYLRLLQVIAISTTWVTALHSTP